MPSLNGVEEVEPDWSHIVQALSALLRPAGRLLLGVPNPLGVHRQVALPESTIDFAGGSGWVRPTELEAAAPASPGRLYELLAAAGLRATDGWVAYPQPHEPTVLARLDTLDADLARVGVLGALCGQAFDPVIEDRAVLLDPRPLVALAAQAGSADLLAPLWIVDGRRADPRPDRDGDWPTEPGPPSAAAPLIVADRPGPFAIT